MAADSSQPDLPRSGDAVVPINHAPSIRGKTATGDEFRHDNPHWPVRSPEDAASALLLHDECPWHCSTRVAAIIVSRNDYQFFRDRGRGGGESWTSPSDW